MTLATGDEAQTPAAGPTTRPAAAARPSATPAAVAATLMFSPLVRHLRRAAIDALGDALKPFGIGPLDALLLRLVARQSLDTDSLRRLTAVDMVTFSRAIRRLQAAQLLEGVPAPNDRRRRIYRLAAAKSASAADIAAAVRRADAALLATLSRPDRERLTRLLVHFLHAHAAGGAVRQDVEIVALLGGSVDVYTLLRRARQITVQVFEDECGALGMTPIETGAIDLIARFGPLPFKHLPKLLAINRGSTVPVIGKLHERGVLDAMAHARRELALSDRGFALQRRLRDGVAVVDARVLSVFTAAQQAQLLALMRRLHLDLAGST